jgi:hypothetical protein
VTVVLTPERIARYAYAAGFRGMALTRAVAVALAESGGRPGAHNDNPPDDSYGLWQINMLGGLGPERRHSFHLASNAALLDPAVNARAAYAISSHGTDFRPWSVFLHGTYRQYVPAARRAAQAVTAENGSGAKGGGASGRGGRRIVLDLAELARLAGLFQHSADRVEHTRRAVANLAADTEAARMRLPDPALATLIGTLLDTADAPTQLRLAASRLDRQGGYAERVKRRAEQADGADGRWSAADVCRFLRSIGPDVDPVERALRETVLGGVIMRGDRVLERRPR